MSFWKKLFGPNDVHRDAPTTQAVKTLEHKGFVVHATPFKENGQFQTSGLITKEVDGTVEEHRFIRADRFAGMDEAVEVSLAKGRQIIDEQGDGLFR